TVALPRRVPRLRGVVGSLDEDRVRGTGPGTQLTANTLLQPVGMTVELVSAVVPRRGSSTDLGILLGRHLLEHHRESDPEALDRVKYSHPSPPYSSEQRRW